MDACFRYTKTVLISQLEQAEDPGFSVEGKTADQMYNSCFRGTMLYSSECWALRKEYKKRLEHSERAMLLWLWNTKKEQVASTNPLLSWLKLKSLDSLLRCDRLCCFGYVKWSELYTGPILDFEVEGNRSRGHPKKFWLDATEDDLRQWKLQAETCQNCGKWRKWLKTASHMHPGCVTWR